MKSPTIKTIQKAQNQIRGVVKETPLERCERLSDLYQADIFLKREDLQPVRSYKIRGAYNFISQMTAEEKKKGIVCASAGNHAQGVAFSCAELRVKGVIFMPMNTPKQKVSKVQQFGGHYIEICLFGDTFDQAAQQAKMRQKKDQSVFVHPFDDTLVSSGQATVGVEIFNQLERDIDAIIVPVGGGGLLAGLGTYFNHVSPETKIIGVEPQGAESMNKAFESGRAIKMNSITNFVDGAAVQQVGSMTYRAARKYVTSLIAVKENRICVDMINLYQQEGIITEPAGALSIASLDLLKKTIKGKTIVCVISGGNNDINRYPEIMDRSLMYQGLKHYFLINLPQRPGALRQMLDEVLGPNDDITLFEYVKKSNKQTGSALVGIELKEKKHIKFIVANMKRLNIDYLEIDHDSPLFNLLV